MSRLLPALVLALVASPLAALDGKWTPAQVLDIDPAWLRAQGLEIEPEQLWDGERGSGLLTGAVSIAGCSGAFVSASGLILTNHHCLFGLIQEHSSPERDLLREGFLARRLEDELPGSTVRVEIPRRFRDVRAELLAAVPEGADPQARRAAIEARQKELVTECQQGGSKCRVAVFDEGLHYTLIESIELRDLRLVYAPPRSIGEFGGEVDNWMWPRHTGDFAIARAWAGPDQQPADRAGHNQPYQPEFHFPIARRGVSEGDFVMLLGYPGITWRALLAEEMGERRERFFVRREDLFGEWIAHLEAAAAVDEAARIALASQIKGIHNRYKNAQGQIAGLERGRILARQKEADDAVAAWAAQQPAHRPALRAREELRRLLAERERTWERDFLLSLIPLGNESVPGGIPPLPKGLYFAASLAHLARERALPDSERAQGFTEAELPRIRERFRREQLNLVPAAEQRLLQALVMRALALPGDQRIEAIDARYAGKDEAAIAAAVEALVTGTALFDPESRESLMDVDLETLAARGDALLDLGIAWNAAMREQRGAERARLAQSAIHRPIWRAAVQAHAGQPIAPDANGTLRVSFAHVQGYDPRDGVRYTAFTTLPGVLAKHSGVAPFELPQAVIEAAAAPGERWIEPALGTLPINFLADGDTSGGNSGSPVINGRGELVGVNFDRVWENVANDFGFNPAVARNISVDVRYLLWLLDRVDGARELLAELGLEER